MNAYDHLGAAPVLNACGIYTDLGGSRLSPTVWRVVEQLNEQYVRMTDLLDSTGEIIATALAAEAARVVPGAAAGIMLGIAACLAGDDGDRWEALPDVSGLVRTGVVIQSGHRYKYDRQAWMTGARRVEVGTNGLTTVDELDAALDGTIAAVIHPAHLDSRPGTVPLDTVIALAHQRDIPVLVDAAYMNHPVSTMSSYTRRGADLAVFSAKYFAGPNAGGFVVGRRDLVRAVAGLDFTRYESGDHLSFGRPLKMDRLTVGAVVVALQEWLAADHDARLDAQQRRVDRLHGALAERVTHELTPCQFTLDERLIDDRPHNCVLVEFPDADAAAAFARALGSGSPAVAAISEGRQLVLAIDAMTDGEEMLLADAVVAQFQAAL